MRGIILMDELTDRKEAEQNCLSERSDSESNDEMLEPIQLTERDVAIFSLAHEHRYIVHNQIREAFWKGRSESAKACNKRVQKLVRTGYLAKGYSKRKSLGVYFATRKSLKILKERGLDSGIGLYKPTEYFDRWIDHDLNVLNLRILFRKLGFDSWISERVIKEREHPEKVPDGIISLGGKRIAIEYESGLTKDMERYQQMLTYYSGHEGYVLLFIIINGDVKDWLVRGLHYDVKRVWITTYKELFRKRGEAVFENKAATFTLNTIL